MKKSFYTIALLLAANLIFSSYRSGDDGFIAGTPIGIGNPTATTDPGVLIGEIDGKPIRWATRNVDYPGTFAATPESAGRLFQWGTLDGITHHWDNTASGAIEDGFDTSWPPRRVAWTSANDPCPAGWRVPTWEEILAFLNATTSEWTNRNGVPGRYFGTATNRIFLPAAGWRNGAIYMPAAGSTNRPGTLWDVGTFSVYWTSTQIHSGGSMRLFFDSGCIGIRGNSGRNSDGYSVRCVAE